MGEQRNLHTEDDSRIEVCFAVARHLKQTGLDTGWPTIVDYSPAGSVAVMTGMSFAQGEAYTEQFHIPHGVDFSMDTCHLDLHYMMTTADASKIVKMKLSLWHIYEGRDVSALTGPDATYTFTISPNANDYVFDDAFVEDALDLSAWETNRSIHDGLIARLERLESGDGDTHGGEFFSIHSEIWLPTDGRLTLTT